MPSDLSIAVGIKTKLKHMSSSLLQVVTMLSIWKQISAMIISNIIVISLNCLTSTLGLKEVNYVLSEQMFLQGRHRLASLGTPSPSKIDEFSEKFQTAFDPPPPPHFRKVILQIF